MEKIAIIIRPRINVKKLYREKKTSKAMQFSTFRDSFKLVQRAFHGGSITFLRLTLKSEL